MDLIEFTDGVITAEPVLESTVYSLQYLFTALASAVPVGLGLGCIPVVIGLGVSGVMKILKRV